MNIHAYRFLATNPRVFQDMARHGVKHLVLEFPKVFEIKLEPFLKGEKTLPEFKKSLFTDPHLKFDSPWIKGDEVRTDAFNSAFAQTIGNARAAGMEVHFVDVTSEKHSNTASKFSQAIQRGLLSEEEIWREGTAIIWQRFDDSAQYALIRERIPMNDKIMGCFGVVHVSSPEIPLNGLNTLFGNPKGIADRLRVEQGIPVTTVGLWANREQEQNVLSGEAHFKIINGMKGTDHSAYFDTKEVEARVKAPPPSPAPQANGPKYAGPGFGSM